MTWANPHALWLLALVPAAAAALWWNAARRRRATQMFGRSATVDRLIAGRAQWWRAARAALMMLGFLPPIILASRPGLM